jgi:hypothetical protein
MSVLWVLPIIVVAVGMVAVAAVSRHAAIAAADLQRGCADLAELGDDITALRSDASAVRRSIEALGADRVPTATTDS